MRFTPYVLLTPADEVIVAEAPFSWLAPGRLSLPEGAPVVACKADLPWAFLNHRDRALIVAGAIRALPSCPAPELDTTN